MTTTPQTESKRAKFERIVEPRVRRAVHAIHVVGLMGGPNKSNYDYGPTDIEAIGDALHNAVMEAMERLARKPKQMALFTLANPAKPNGSQVEGVEAV